MKKITGKNESFETFLKSSMTALDFDNLYITLNISKRMLTFILREPNKMDINQAKKLSEITNKPIESITYFID